MAKKAYKNNECKIFTPTWDEKLGLLDSLCSVANINHYKGLHQQHKHHETLMKYPRRSM